jgi:hypothetical protein
MLHSEVRVSGLSTRMTLISFFEAAHVVVVVQKCIMKSLVIGIAEKVIVSETNPFCKQRTDSRSIQMHRSLSDVCKSYSYEYQVELEYCKCEIIN